MNRSKEAMSFFTSSESLGEPELFSSPFMVLPPLAARWAATLISLDEELRRAAGCAGVAVFP